MADLYQFELEEHNGEQEYSYIEYVLADSQEQAEEYADTYAARWYPDAEVEVTDDDEGKRWSADFGGVAWRINYVAPAEPIRIRYAGAGNNKGGIHYVDLSKVLREAKVSP